MELFSVREVQFRGILHYPQVTIKAGQATFLCGQSGCGKSTLLKLLNASVSPDSGEIRYQGKPLSEFDTIALRREVMLVSQTVFLFDDTIRNNFAQFYAYREQNAPTDDEIAQYLHLCSAEYSLDANCRTLSGGERQRVFLAICLSLRPRVLMLDEPTSALDQATADTLLRTLKAYCMQHDMTLIAVTHDLALAQRYADVILEIGGRT
ncbi:MAG: ATP-binding cassette domain-containing protein [Clostridia bacterium]|nr:ATP-binding cassette domain-containing protein [Clostridia bacterium]